MAALVTEPMSNLLQENLLTIVCFNDAYAATVRDTVKLEHYEQEYRKVAKAAYRYIDRYKKPPGIHIPDELEDELNKKTPEAKYLKSLLHALHKSKDTINPIYVMERLTTFVRRQELRSATITAAEYFTSGKLDDAALSEIEANFTRAMKKQLQIFDAGISMGDVDRSLAFLSNDEKDTFPTGIKELDELRLGPARKTLHLFIGLPKAGKTHWMVNLGKKAWKEGHKVLHVSLEMDEDRMSQRYYQALFALSKRRPKEGQTFKRTTLAIDTSGELEAIHQKVFTPRHTLQDADVGKYLEKRTRRLSRRLKRIIIKSFPTGQLTIPMLNTYLDHLEIRHDFRPDLMLVDYPQLMAHDIKYRREALGKIIQDLRGISQERNMAVAVVGQSSRKGKEAKQVDVEHVAEDFSMVMTADNILTYSQTADEKALGLARLHVAGGRDEEDKFTVLISQHYGTGQFCVDSVRQQRGYLELLQDAISVGVEGEEEHPPSRSTRVVRRDSPATSRKRKRPLDRTGRMRNAR